MIIAKIPKMVVNTASRAKSTNGYTLKVYLQLTEDASVSSNFMIISVSLNDLIAERFHGSTHR